MQSDPLDKIISKTRMLFSQKSFPIRFFELCRCGGLITLSFGWCSKSDSLPQEFSWFKIDRSPQKNPKKFLKGLKTIFHTVEQVQTKVLCWNTKFFQFLVLVREAKEWSPEQFFEIRFGRKKVQTLSRKKFVILDDAPVYTELQKNVE